MSYGLCLADLLEITRSRLVPSCSCPADVESDPCYKHSAATASRKDGRRVIMSDAFVEPVGTRLIPCRGGWTLPLPLVLFAGAVRNWHGGFSYPT